MSFIDVILIVALVAFTAHGFAKGFFRKVFSLIALLIGIYIAAKDSKEIAAFVGRLLDVGEMMGIVIGIVAIFAGLFIIASLLAKGFRRVPILQLWDKFGGALFGILEGALFLSLLLLLLSLFDVPPNGPSLQKSIIYKPLKGFAGQVYEIFTTNKTAEKYMNEFFAPTQKSSSKIRK